LKINPHWKELPSEQESFTLPLPVKDHRFIDSSLTKIGSGIRHIPELITHAHGFRQQVAEYAVCGIRLRILGGDPSLAIASAKATSVSAPSGKQLNRLERPQGQDIHRFYNSPESHKQNVRVAAMQTQPADNIFQLLSCRRTLHATSFGCCDAHARGTQHLPAAAMQTHAAYNIFRLLRCRRTRHTTSFGCCDADARGIQHLSVAAMQTRAAHNMFEIF
jgi:hypothetical protein